MFVECPLEGVGGVLMQRGMIEMPLTGAQRGVRACLGAAAAGMRRERLSLTLLLSDVYVSGKALVDLGTSWIAAAEKCKLCVIALIFMFPSDAESEAHATCRAHYHTIFECSVTCSSLLAF